MGNRTQEESRHACSYQAMQCACTRAQKENAQRKRLWRAREQERADVHMHCSRRGMCWPQSGTACPSMCRRHRHSSWQTSCVVTVFREPGIKSSQHLWTATHKSENAPCVYSCLCKMCSRQVRRRRSELNRIACTRTPYSRTHTRASTRLRGNQRHRPESGSLARRKAEGKSRFRAGHGARTWRGNDPWMGSTFHGALALLTPQAWLLSPCARFRMCFYCAKPFLPLTVEPPNALILCASRG